MKAFVAALILATGLAVGFDVQAQTSPTVTATCKDGLVVFRVIKARRLRRSRRSPDLGCRHVIHDDGAGEPRLIIGWSFNPIYASIYHAGCSGRGRPSMGKHEQQSLPLPG